MKTNKLDQIFSEYIRLRDSDNKGYINCCYCGLHIYWKNACNAHYFKRANMSLRFHEQNCHASHFECNSRSENDFNIVKKYTKFMIKKYGNETLEYLEIMAKSTVKFTNYEINELTKHYKDKVLILKKR